MTKEAPSEIAIRGHHIPIFGSLVRIHYGLAHSGSKNAIKNAAEAVAINMIVAVRTDEPDYCNDILGTTDSSANTYRSAIINLFTEFLTLPDNTHARLISNYPDGLCGSCTIGEHCKDDTDFLDSNFIKILTINSNHTEHMTLGELRTLLLSTNPDLIFDQGSTI